MTVTYHYAIAATQKLRRAGLRVDAVYRTICSYDCGRAAGSTTLADCGADLSPFAGKTQVLYYIPADYTEPGEAADDFGGKSVFRTNAATPDRQLFDPAMKQVLAEYERMKNDPTIAIRYIDVCVSSSPDGKFTLNESLAGTRAENIRATIYGQLEEEDRPMLRITAEAENWNTLSKALPASDIDDKAAVERILADYTAIPTNGKPRYASCPNGRRSAASSTSRAIAASSSDTTKGKNTHTPVRPTTGALSKAT